jgi:hypothetical protein
MKTMFKQLYTASAEMLDLLKMPKVEGKIKRALDGAIDAYECDKIDLEEKIDKLMVKLAKGDISAIKEIQEAELELDALGQAIAKIEKTKTRMFFEVKEPKE